MDDWLQNPAVQAGVAPLLAALCVAIGLRRSRLLGLAIGAAFAMVIMLTIGFTFESLTSMRKMVLAGLGTIVLVSLLELSSVAPTRTVRTMVAVGAGLVAIWVLLRILQQKDLATALAAGLASATYMVLLVLGTHTLRDEPVRAASSSLGLGLGAAGLAVMGASALLAQVGVAIAAGAGAVLAVQVTTGGGASTRWTLAMPAGVIAGLVGLLSVFTGELSSAALLPLLAVPLAALAVPLRPRPPWRTALLASPAALAPAALAVLLAWRFS